MGKTFDKEPWEKVTFGILISLPFLNLLISLSGFAVPLGNLPSFFITGHGILSNFTPGTPDYRQAAQFVLGCNVMLVVALTLFAIAAIRYATLPRDLFSKIRKLTFKFLGIAVLFLLCFLFMDSQSSVVYEGKDPKLFGGGKIITFVFFSVLWIFVYLAMPLLVLWPGKWEVSHMKFFPKGI